MKATIPLFFGYLLFQSCGQSTSADRFKDFLPGTYVAHIEQEYSIGEDTIVIEAISTAKNTYSILRVATYQRILDGKIQPKERKEVKRIAIYSDKEGMLLENKTGKQYYFSPEKGLLLIGNASYRKLN